MINVLPNINCSEYDEAGVRDRLRVAETFSDWIHLDIADGVFTFAPSWGTPVAWRAMQSKLNLEVHIMVEHPERVVPDWIDAGAKRIIVHFEAFSKTRGNQHMIRNAALAEIVERCKHAGVEIFLALNPETTLAMAAHVLPHFDGFQIFSQAHPGPSGQPFLASVLPKITALRQQFPNATIEVDGGITKETAARAVRAGANAVVSGTYLYTAPDPKAAYESLRALS